MLILWRWSMEAQYYLLDYAVELALEMIRRNVNKDFACLDAAETYGVSLALVIRGVNIAV